ncbi:MAG: hypothetical protein A3F10_03550 [Coxiella sp. RIFCSPHIGHO2_12_FULL_42_15]|nr:MAG: hypothetical protein A3F10_03550 [Coxiella sp. RIFCSPHIGHO2_12_FULL_42_15]
MPTINQLTIENFRNLTHIVSDFSERFNVCFGVNGSGKTSLLEAIYYLGLGKSFRTAQCARIVQHQHEHCRVIARITGNKTSLVGIERHQNGDRVIKHNGEFQNSMLALTRLIPIQFMSPMSYRFFHDGPKLRRSYLDWALFHVEPSFLDVWQRFQRMLKQRNSALKLQQDLMVWNTALADAATLIDRMRSNLIPLLETNCFQQLQFLLPHFEFTLRYQRGWPQETELLSLLKSHRLRDQQLGYTFYGPQRADVQLFCNAIPVQDILSQGQQKLAAYALHLALGTLLQQTTDVSPVYLIDDLPSELDANSRFKITQTLNSLGAQVFITGIAREDLIDFLPFKQTRLFHVEHGNLA